MKDDEIEEITDLIFNDNVYILNKYKEEVERLHNIIKEVREYVETMYIYGIRNNSQQRDELLKILDKEKIING